MDTKFPPEATIDLKSERVQRELTQLHQWRPTNDYKGLELPLSFPDLTERFVFVETVARLAGREQLEGMQLVVIASAVVVTLRHPTTYQGVTPSQLRFAKLLNEQQATQAGRVLLEEEVPG